MAHLRCEAVSRSVGWFQKMPFKAGQQLVVQFLYHSALEIAEALFEDVQRKVADFLLICKGKCQELLAKYESQKE